MAERDMAELDVRADGGPRSGDVLGQYQLLACVGEGGMGRVWAARNISSVLQRLVASSFENGYIRARMSPEGAQPP